MASVAARMRLMSWLPSVIGRQRARRVAGVDAGLLDVLHDAAEVELLAVVEGVDVDLDGLVEELVDQHRVVAGRLGLPCRWSASRRRRRCPCRRRPARRRAGPAPGSRSRRRSASASSTVVAVPCLGAGRPASASTRPNAPRSSARWIDSGEVPTIGHPGVLERLRQAERRLAAELHDDARDRAGLLLGVDDLQDVLQGERLEVEPVGGVVVGRDGLGVAVDHDGLVARPADSSKEACTHA